MVGNEVEDNFDRAPMRFVQKPHEASEFSKNRGDVAIVGDVIAEIGHRRWIYRGNPDRVDLEPGEVIQSLNDTLKIADTVAVRVEERARIDLIDDAVLPPAGGQHQWSSCGLPRTTMLLATSSFPSACG